MKKKKYDEEVKKAMKKLESGEDQVFWSGYIRGLNQRFKPENFDSLDFLLWMELLDSVDSERRNKGRGFEAGFFGPARLTTDFLYSKAGVPVFVDWRGNVLDYSEGFRRFREWHGLTRKQLAGLCSVSHRAVEKWEYKQGSRPRAEALLMLKRHLDNVLMQRSKKQ
ncbi:MAG: helix-turn-helix domain-containing protein [Desulfobacteraceae bacterium]|nr:helix-turn-helix domain-containing protein [Desulfobacteraceae bacterium]